MQITILFFGQLTEITGVATVQLEHIADTDALVIQLRQKFPALAS
jgi:molybdopterin converting factor small subunit